MTSKTTSKDGTPLAFDQIGQGPPVILVVGAFNDRMKGAPLAAALAPHFTVFSYDRRGKGDSGDAAEYAVDREIEDLEAMIHAAGGSASVFGYSSGAVLALRAAARPLAITKLALYDTPPGQPSLHAAALAALVAAGRRGDAVEYFQRKMVGIPEHVVEQLRHAPFRPALEAMAHTLVYEAKILAGDPVSPAAPLPPSLLARIVAPTLAIVGGAGAPVMREIAASVAQSLPRGRSLILAAETHEIVPEVLAPVLQRFFGGASETG